MKKLLVLVASLFAFATVSNAQVCALKANALYLLGGAVSVGAEFSVAPQWTVDVQGTGVIFSPFRNVGKDPGLLYINGWDAVAEARYYLCKAFNGHHFGAYLEGARLGQVESSMGGFGSGAALTNAQIGLVGVSYGYYFKLSTYWGIDVTGGVGIGAARHDTRRNFEFACFPRGQVAFSYKF